MQPDPHRHASSLEAPDFIPDDLLTEYLDEARLRVIATYPEVAEPPTVEAAPAPRRTGTRQPAGARGPLADWSPKDRALALFAAKLAFVGWALLVALWSWLAWSIGGETWVRIAIAGWISLLPGAIAVAHLSGKRIVWSRRRGRRVEQDATV